MMRRRWAIGWSSNRSETLLTRWGRSYKGKSLSLAVSQTFLLTSCRTPGVVGFLSVPWVDNSLSICSPNASSNSRASVLYLLCGVPLAMRVRRCAFWTDYIALPFLKTPNSSIFALLGSPVLVLLDLQSDSGINISCSWSRMANSTMCYGIPSLLSKVTTRLMD